MNNPYQHILNPFEQKLRDEVIYLHSLWHQGPPSFNPNPHLHHPPLLHVSNSTHFKRRKKTNKRKTKNKKFNASSKQPISDPGPEWPVDSPQQSPARTASGWPAFVANSGSLSKPVSDVEIPELGKKQIQQKVVKSCNKFFTKMIGLDDDDDDVDDDDDGDELMEESVEQSEEFKFLLNLFVENEELRKLYEDDSESGEFYCLVCRGVGEKLAKKYKGCLSLVNHAKAISKTSRKRAHRAFAFVICRVIGWDFARLPIVVIKGECLSRSLLNSKNKEKSTVLYKIDIEATQIGENEEESVDCLGPECSLITVAQLSQPEHSDKSHLHATSSGSPPQLEPQTISLSCSVPLEELAQFTVVQLQQKFVEESKKLWANPTYSNSDEDDNDYDDPNDVEQIAECEEFKSFMRLFSENSELRNFYESRHEDGEFCCLVCCSIGKAWKIFKGCGELLQHVANATITRKKFRRAHRALGLVICEILRWDVAQFQRMVVKEPVGQSLAAASVLQVELNKNNNQNNEDLNSAVDNTESVCCDNNK